MQNAPQFESFHAELHTGSTLLKGSFMPRGDLLIYLNDQNRDNYPINDVTLYPLLPDYKVRPIHQETIVTLKDNLIYLALTNNEDAAKIQIMQSKRPVIFYTQLFAIRGQFHVHEEKRDDDMVDTDKPFAVITDASVFPLRPVAHEPQRHVPLLALNVHHILAYHAHHSKTE